MVAAIAVRGGAGTGVTPPTGWTLVPGGSNPIDNGTALRLAVYYKVAGAAEPASYTWTFTSTEKASGGIQAYANVDPVDPIDAALGQATPSGTLHSTPAVTTTVDGAMLVASFALASGASWTPQTAGLIERYDEASVGGPPNTRTASQGTEQLQATAGGSGVMTSASSRAAPGAAHLLALVPRRTTVECLGLAAGARETLCLRARPATSSAGVVVYASSVPTQINGMVGIFRRAGSAVVGDVAIEEVSARISDLAHAALPGDPALVAAGQVRLVSAGAAAVPRAVTITGIVYTFAGADNPGGGCVPPSPCTDDLLGSAAMGIDFRHGADQVTVTLRGPLMSNGAIRLEDVQANSGTLAARHDGAAVESPPAALAPLNTDNVLVPLSWSSGD
ncbi:MAG TPA: hypothetical protein VNN19_02575, partial [bacterium]|nr:hypothetical protein [bacterium]